MQKDMKVGMLAGLVLAAGAMLYVCTRSDFSTKSRILNREKQEEAQLEQQSQRQVRKMVTFSPATAKAEAVMPSSQPEANAEQTRFSQQLPSFGQTAQDRRGDVVQSNTATEQSVATEIEAAPVRTYKPKKFYIVRKGDTLSKISQKYYGTANQWYLIFDANRDVLSNPNKIKPGLKLHIPD